MVVDLGDLRQEMVRMLSTICPMPVPPLTCTPQANDI